MGVNVSQGRSGLCRASVFRGGALGRVTKKKGKNMPCGILIVSPCQPRTPHRTYREVLDDGGGGSDDDNEESSFFYLSVISFKVTVAQVNQVYK